jgi:diphthine synthase
MKIEKVQKKLAVAEKALVVAIARAGSDHPMVRAGFAKDMLTHEFGEPPHTLVFPGELHFTEAEALIALAGAPEEIRVK